MKTLRLEIELEYDDEVMHGDDQDGIDWFYNEILIGDGGLLQLHSNHIGDHVGEVKGIKILDTE